MSDTDVFEQEAAKIAPDTMKTASEIAKQFAQLTIEEERLKADLKTVSDKLHHMKTVTVPDIMAQAGQSSFTLHNGEFNGVKVAVSDFVGGSLPKDTDKRQQAANWLEVNNASSLVRNVVTVEIPKEKNNDVHRLLDELKQAGYVAERQIDVHHMSLQAFARERLRKGEDLPADLLGLYIGRAAKLTWPKERGFK